MDEKFIRKIASLISEDVDIFENKPAIAPPKPGTTPSKPKERPKFKPFNPPRPAKQPQPKASTLVEDFRTSAHPSTVDFWQNIRGSEHPYGKHPLMAMYGYESADRAFTHGLEKLREVFPELRNMPPQQATQMAPQFAMQALQAMMRLEQPHAQQLEQLAVKAVSEAWKVPSEMLRAMLTPNPQPDMREEDEDEDEDENEVQDVDLPQFDKETLRPQINKRITMNAMTQGAAVHNMATIHHIVKDDLDKIEPRLLQLYQRFASGATHFYWIIDFVNLTKLALQGGAIGWSGVQYDENDEPVVVAKAVNFPVLVQELVKGVMELLSHHGLEGLSRGELDVVYGEADRLEDEPWLIQIGPQIWRTFLSIVPKGHDLVTIVAQLARQEPDYIHKVLSQAVEAAHSGADPAEAKQAMIELMDQLEEHTGEDLFDADDYDEFEEDDEYGY